MLPIKDRSQRIKSDHTEAKTAIRADPPSPTECEIDLHN